MKYTLPKYEMKDDNATTHELIPRGDYDLEIVSATDRDADGNLLTTKAGDPRIRLQLKEDEGRTFYHFLYLSERAIPMVWEFLSALGYESEGEFELDVAGMVGKRFRGHVYEDNGWNRMRKPIATPTSAQSNPDPSDPLQDDAVEDGVPF